MKILVVDDSSTMRRIICNALKGLGEVTIVEAEDGQDGLDKYQANTDVELVLADWNMPKLTGFQMLEKLVAGGCKAPIIMVTTEAEKSNVFAAIKAGAKNYVTKPFTPDVLIGNIKQTLKIA